MTLFMWACSLIHMVGIPLFVCIHYKYSWCFLGICIIGEWNDPTRSSQVLMYMYMPVDSLNADICKTCLQICKTLCSKRGV